MSNSNGNGLWRFSKPDWLSLPADSEMLGVVIAVTLILFTAAYYIYYYYYYYPGRKPRGCLDRDKFQEFKLVKKTQVSHNVARFRFALPTPKSVLALPIGKHVICRGKDKDGLEVIRPYTPISLDSDLGYFELLVKMYPMGRMSHHYREMREGDYLPVKGPMGRFVYKPGQARAFGLIAGGSGITPILQLTRAILQNPKDKTKVHLIYCNTTFEDILLKEEFDGFARKFPTQFSVYYVLSKPTGKWDGGAGHITKEMIQQHCPAPAPDIQILRCGPPGLNKAVADFLNAIGYTPQMQFEF